MGHETIRTGQARPSRLAVVAAVALLLTTDFAAASPPQPRPDLLHNARYAYLVGRSCASLCGADRQLCCGTQEQCTTLPGNVATCVASGAVASPLYTTTWTVTYTSTVMTWFVPAPTPVAGQNCVPQRPEWQACGEICCDGWQSCARQGQCVSRSDYGEPSAALVTSNGVVTSGFNAPYRTTGTSVTTGVVTPTPVAPGDGTAASPTSTDDFGFSPPATADTGTAHNKLSGAAIAGIVIGSLTAAGLLCLLCFCCIARGIFNALCGGRSRRPKADRVDEYSTSGYSRRDRHSGWLGSGAGGGGGRPMSVSERRAGGEKKSSSGAKWLGVAGLATTILGLLNMNRDKKPPPPPSSRKAATSRFTDSYYSYSDYTSTTPSSASSGGRTARTGRTGRSVRTGRSARTRDSRDSRSRMTRYTARSSHQE